jgi:hypothetical protein
MRSARVGDVALIEKPADEQSLLPVAASRASPSLKKSAAIASRLTELEDHAVKLGCKLLVAPCLRCSGGHCVRPPLGDDTMHDAGGNSRAHREPVAHPQVKTKLWKRSTKLFVVRQCGRVAADKIYNACKMKLLDKQGWGGRACVIQHPQ